MRACLKSGDGDDAVIERRRHSRCWYCGAGGLKLTREHLLSETHFGGRLVSPDSICQRCNSLAGKVEALAAEHPFVSEAIAEYRTRKGGKRFPQSRAVLRDGARVQVERRPGGTWIIDFEPRQIHTDSDGTEVWEVAAGREAEFEQRRRRRGERVRVVGRPLGAGGYMELRYGVGASNFAAWPRFVAKIALSTTSLVVDEQWLDSDGALALQDMFHERPRPGAARYELPLYPWEQDRSQWPWSGLAAGEHVLGVWRNNRGDGCHFGLTLFGYLVAEAELRDIRCPSDEPTWIVPCDGGQSTRLSRAQFGNLLSERATRGRSAPPS